jgi:hypothetical protein
MANRKFACLYAWNPIIQVDKETFDELIAACDKAKADRANKMPDEVTALKQMFEAYQRLKEIGFDDIIYCPKDVAVFDSISAGSTGIHDCFYMGEWPNGKW